MGDSAADSDEGRSSGESEDRRNSVNSINLTHVGEDTGRLSLAYHHPGAVLSPKLQNVWKEVEDDPRYRGTLRPRHNWGEGSRPFTKEELHKMRCQYESIAENPPHSLAYRQHLSIKRPVSGAFKWVLLMLIGITTGIVGLTIFQCIQGIGEKRTEMLETLVRNARRDNSVAGYVGAYFAWTGLSLFLVTIATLLVKFVPPAGGSGVPDVMAYLNGIMFNKVFNIRTLFAKWLSCITAVGSGLPVGPEGPMIHIGAIIGAGVGSGKSKSLKFSFSNVLKLLGNPQDHRDAITGGAAAGVAVAFGAPIGGLLFVFEEVATHWRTSLSYLIFACSLSASVTFGLIASQLEGWHLRGEASFGYFIGDATVLFQVFADRWMHIGDLIPAAIIGVCGGLLGALFTKLNVTLLQIRLRRKSSMVKTLEPIVVLFLYVTISFFIPLISRCHPLPNFAPTDESPIIDNPDIIPPGFFVTAPCDEEHTFSPTATLFWNPGEHVIRLLFQRHTPFDYVSLIPFALTYFIFSCYCCGMQISSGIVVPMLLTGGTIGRLIGHIIYANIDSTQHEGVYAVIGAAAYFAGVSRLTVSLVVIMIELTNEKRFMLLIMVAVMVAKYVADYFCHALYHSMLEKRQVPFLDSGHAEVLMSKHLTCFRAYEVAHTPVVCLRNVETLSYMASLLKNCKHSAFPVVDKDFHFLGLLARDSLFKILWHIEDFGPPTIGSIPWEDMEKCYEKHFLRDEIVPRSVQAGDFPDIIKDFELDLLPYVDTSALSINGAVSITVVYRMFMSLGLRHIIVVDECGKVGGIITRKDLLPFRLESFFHDALHSPTETTVLFKQEDGWVHATFEDTPDPPRFF